MAWILVDAMYKSELILKKSFQLLNTIWQNFIISIQYVQNKAFEIFKSNYEKIYIFPKYE